MAPGDIYIGKATLDQYEITVVDPERSTSSIEVLHMAGCDNVFVGYFDTNHRPLSPHDFLKSVIDHEKVCTNNDPNKKRT